MRERTVSRRPALVPAASDWALDFVREWVVRVTLHLTRPDQSGDCLTARET